MKVSRIEIKDFQQFKDFELDLTYPEGHTKAGQPLDKVCFIGQSGTGKTTILRFIKSFFSNVPCITDAKEFEKIIGKFYIECNNVGTRIETVGIGFNKNIVDKNINDYEIYNATFVHEPYINLGNFNESLNYIYFPAELLDNAASYIENQFAIKNPLENIKTSQEIEKIRQNIKDKIENKHYYDFSKDNPTDIWYAIYFDIIEYEDDRKNFDREISQAMLNKNYELAEKLTNNLQEWLLNNNPLEKIARVINPIVSKFGVEIDTKATYKNSENIFIRINVKKDNINVPYKNWSTGTKQIILLATPLIQLDTKNSIILIDEPERSLFPDVQRTLIKYYTELAPEAQFFFATHSPIIASQFEPWEIVELKFDENGNVYREDYLKKDMSCHVDNYKFYPEYLRWDEVLTRVFDLDSEGNKREEILSMALYCQAKIEKMKDKEQNNGAEFEKLMQDYQKLAHKLGWNVYEKNN